MSQWDDYNADSQFAHDFPYDIPNEYWCMNNGKILVKDMSTKHIKNCMAIVGADDKWYNYFQQELNSRKDINKLW